MQIFLSVIVNIIVLAVVLPLFYIFIMSRARERLEDETLKKVRDELNALVHEFNRSALSNVSLLEDAILRVRREYSDIISKESSRIDGKVKKNDDNSKDNNLSEFDKIENDRKQISNMKKFSDNANKKSINIVVDDNINNNIETQNYSGTMTKAQIETALRKIKQNISFSEENNVRHGENIIKETKKIDNINSDRLDKNKLIIKLYKDGLSNEEIARETKTSITEVSLVLDIELDDN